MQKVKKIHLITLGDSKVGKTSLLRTFSNGKPSLCNYTTLGVDSCVKNLQLGDKKETVEVTLWDTPGQERYYTMTKSVYKRCRGVLLVYDVGNRKSFENISRWMTQIEKDGLSGLVLYLVANKIDLPTREVMTAEGEKLAASYHLPYFETSAKKYTNIVSTFTQLAEASFREECLQPSPVNIELEPAPIPPVSKRRCC